MSPFNTDGHCTIIYDLFLVGFSGGQYGGGRDDFSYHNQGYGGYGGHSDGYRNPMAGYEHEYGYAGGAFQPVCLPIPSTLLITHSCSS